MWLHKQRLRTATITTAAAAQLMQMLHFPGHLVSKRFVEQYTCTVNYCLSVLYKILFYVEQEAKLKLSLG